MSVLDDEKYFPGDLTQDLQSECYGVLPVEVTSAEHTVVEAGKFESTCAFGKPSMMKVRLATPLYVVQQERADLLDRVRAG